MTPRAHRCRADPNGRRHVRDLAGAVCVLALLVAGCYGLTPIGGERDGGADDASPLPDGAPWPDSDVWWPDATPADVGPVCPDPGGPLVDWACDVLTQRGCGPGEGCYGWTETSPDPCAREVYRSSCFPEGIGGQGDPCDQWCRAGFECFVTGEGTQCLHVCNVLGAEPSCPPGLICRPTDLPVLGACN